MESFVCSDMAIVEVEMIGTKIFYCFDENTVLRVSQLRVFEARSMKIDSPFCLSLMCF